MGWDSRELLNRAMWPLSLCYSRGYQHLVVHVWSPMAATRAEGREGGSSAERGHRRAGTPSRRLHGADAQAGTRLRPWLQAPVVCRKPDPMAKI